MRQTAPLAGAKNFAIMRAMTQRAQNTPPNWPLSEFIASLPQSAPFVGPETIARAMGRDLPLRLGANEQRFGPSPRAVAAMRAAAADVWMYGDPEGHDLRAALAARHGCPPAHIVLGEGVDALLGLILRLTVARGDRVVLAQGTYPTVAFHVAGCGADLRAVPYLNDGADLPAMAQMVRDVGAKVVYLANPDNPMGSHHSAADVAAFLEALPDSCLLILDEAYIDFAPAGTAPNLAPDDPRVIRTRSFSKSYGLAGLRLGYAICAAPLARAFDLLRNHFGVGRLVQAAGLAALDDHAHLAAVIAGSVAARARLAEIAADNGLRALPSATNFTCLDLGGDGNRARACVAALAQRGIFVRMPIATPQNRCLRISHGTDPDLDQLAEALPAALALACS